jgi:hypothetical protein
MATLGPLNWWSKIGESGILISSKSCFNDGAFLFLVCVTGINSGKATSLIILSPQLSTSSFDKPTHVRLEESTRTSPVVGECDFDRFAGVVCAGCSDRVNIFSVLLVRKFSLGEIRLDMDASEVPLVRVSMAPDLDISEPSINEELFLVVGEEVGEGLKLCSDE